MSNLPALLLLAISALLGIVTLKNYTHLTVDHTLAFALPRQIPTPNSRHVFEGRGLSPYWECKFGRCIRTSAFVAKSGSPWRWVFAGLGTAMLTLLLSPAVAKSSFQVQRARLCKVSVPAKLTEDHATPVPVWVVNLDRSIERWNRLESQLKEQHVAAERFPATLGAALTDAELKDKATTAARLFCTLGMIGCFVSHQRVWQRVVDEDLPAVVVLEDDAVVFANFNSNLQRLIGEMPEDWDVCLLGAVGCIDSEKESLHMKLYGLATGGTRKSPGQSRSVSPNLYVPYKPAGTHAYMVSRRGAAKLLERLPKARYHVDLSAWSLQDLNLYAAKEFLATQEFGDDTTVSKIGAPKTMRFLEWCVRYSGLWGMAQRSGIPNLTWAWKTALFALPRPFSPKRKIVVELGPTTSVWVIILIMSICLRSPKLVAVFVAYLGVITGAIRGLAGTFNFRVALPLLALIVLPLRL
eukprot:TRINITY_DN102632_c0_g1_i1.p1 TRINITY_DN102632_c0_g1~~TRINITY_DN102632_c0_g1_i1.p1  ORF type:complete len:467 (-),score=50.74 TRINITY_DN102632_c0_g1_i1:40-1440(-)